MCFSAYLNLVVVENSYCCPRAFQRIFRRLLGYARVRVGGAVGYDVRRPAAVGGNTPDSRRRNHAARDNEEVSILAQRVHFCVVCVILRFFPMFLTLPCCGLLYAGLSVNMKW